MAEAINGKLDDLSFCTIELLPPFSSYPREVEFGINAVADSDLLNGFRECIKRVMLALVLAKQWAIHLYEEPLWNRVQNMALVAASEDVLSLVVIDNDFVAPEPVNIFETVAGR